MVEKSDKLVVLITNAFFRNWSGSELYVADLALELVRRGHKAVVYSPRLGKLADEMRSKSIPVVDDFGLIGVKPDLIHGQHHLETMKALSFFPGVPAVFFCHGWTPWEEIPPIHPRILRYVAINHAVQDRLIYECGVAPEKISGLLNFVDLAKFSPRQPLPYRPKKALIFDNQSDEKMIALVRGCCLEKGIELDVIGFSSGTATEHPETVLGEYDLVFARGRSALESVAVGCAVISCSMSGMGGMVSTQNVEWIRNNNFGIRVNSQAISQAGISAEIDKYDAEDAGRVSRWVREGAGLTSAVDQVLEIYAKTVVDWRASGARSDASAELAVFHNYLSGLSGEFYRRQENADQDYKIIQSMNQDLILFHDRAEAGRVELEAVRRQVDTNQAELAEACSQVDTNQAELAEARRQVEASQVELAEARRLVEASQVELGEVRGQVEACQAELDGVSRQAEEYRREAEEQHKRADAGQLEFVRLRGTRTFRMYDWFHNQPWLRKMVDRWVSWSGKRNDA
jgi:hypothetical protein